jgi:biotin carboxyl carrier protein
MLQKYITTFNKEESPVQFEEIEGGKIRIVSDDKEWILDAQKAGPNHYCVLHEGQSFDIRFSHNGAKTDAYWGRELISFDLEDSRLKKKAGAGGAKVNLEGPIELTAIMPGKVSSVKVKKGDAVTEGQGLIVLEAMKMENELTSPKAGKVTDVRVKEGQSVEGGAVMIIVE